MDTDGLPLAVAETVAKASVALFVPIGGPAVLVWEAVRGRMADRAQLTIDEITEQVGIDRLTERLSASAQFEALTVCAVDAAVRTSYEGKRRLLVSVVVNAAVDDALVDESQIIAQVLRDLDAPHIRALERIRLAEDAAVGAKDDPVSLGEARREAAGVAANKESQAVQAALVRTGTAAPGTYLDGGIGIAYVSDFGRSLLNSLR